MKIIQENAEASFNYLSINGLAVTYDTNVMHRKLITGPLSDSTFTDRIASRNSNSLSVNFTVSAGSGNLAINFLVLDPMEPSNQVTGVPPNPLPPPLIVLPLTGSSQISSSPTTVRLVITNGQAYVWVNGVQTSLGNLSVPMLWQIQVVISSGGPFSVIGTYEEKR